MSIELRCFCIRHTLLALCGRDTKTGKPYVHIKTTKNRNIITEVVVTSGSARIRCRECLRWHTITIVKGVVNHTEEDLPDSITV